eukprot:TRINITY_DN3160_c0_g1_i1.p2 TRINITY_DN3160_c0_g1~~TRINITY_DN3160_c0_g1_i1.p2  ORF type:complete len:50 (-),score=3.17 TRINITY_DN3160_c0_g1_i1:88-237(-)
MSLGNCIQLASAFKFFSFISWDLKMSFLTIFESEILLSFSTPANVDEFF